MADKKITQLDPVVVASSAFQLPIVDTTIPETKRISFGNMFASPGPVGTSNPDTAVFTDITLSTGATIIAFTTDTNLSGDSDSHVPTEKAVKAYVDSQISGLVANKIWADDSKVEVVDDGTSAGYVQIVTDGVQVAKFDSLSSSIRIGKDLDDKARFFITDDSLKFYGPTPLDQLDISYPSMRMGFDGEQRLYISGNLLLIGKPEASQYISIDTTTGIDITTGSSTLSLSNTDQRIGNFGSTRVELNQTSNSIKLYSNSNLEGKFDSTGLTLVTGLTLGSFINEFSTDGTLVGDSDLAIPTEKAVKTYVDNAISTITVNVDKIYKGLTSAQAFDDTGFSGIVFKTRDFILGDSTGTLISTFRYNGYSSSNFTNPGNMVDGSLLSHATAGPAAGTYTQINNSNTVTDSTAVGTIIKVELRVYANTGVGIGEMVLYPLFGGSNYGNSIDFLGTNGWSPYFDITNDSQAPLDWTWEDLKNLSVQVQAKVNLPGGDSTNTVKVRQIELKITYANQSLIEGSKEVANFDKQGLILEYGVRINKFSSDGTLVGNSNSTIPTERAIKTYVDSVISDLDLLKVRVISYDSTATTGEAIIVDATNDVVVHIIPKMDGKYIVKNASNYKVTIIPSFGTIDKQSLYILDIPMKSVTILSNGASLFIV